MHKNMGQVVYLNLLNTVFTNIMGQIVPCATFDSLYSFGVNDGISGLKAEFGPMKVNPFLVRRNAVINKKKQKCRHQLFLAPRSLQRGRSSSPQRQWEYYH